MFMKTRKYLLLITLILITFMFTSCTYIGRNNIELFSKKFNDYSTDELTLDENNLVINKEQKSYYYFFPASGENEYLLSLFEDSNKEIYEFGICIMSNSPKDVKTIEEIFNSAFQALISTQKETPSPFSEIPLNDKGEIKNPTNKTIEHDLYNINILVNDAGTGIYVVKK